MRALLITPLMTLKEIELGHKVNELECAVHGPPMIVRQADDYIVIVSAVSAQVALNHNEIASALAEVAVYGRAVIIGADGKAWCGLSQYRIEKIYERKSRICRLRKSTQAAKRRSKKSRPARPPKK